jgi:hypothetical protein
LCVSSLSHFPVSSFKYLFHDSGGETNVTWIGHINNLYNTTFWALIQIGGLDPKSAEKELLVSHSDCFEVEG